jgi:probable addiction module antidote protein
MTTAIREFDAAHYLDDETTMTEYLSACAEDTNPDVFLSALGDAVKARRIAQLARGSGLSRSSR